MAALQMLAFLALTAGVSSSETSDCSYVGLLKHLNLTPADDLLAIMRPVKNWQTTTNVTLDMFLYGILHVDEKSQTLTSHVQVHMLWQNELLTWNSSDFCGIDMVTVPRSRVWIPDISITEDASDTGTIQKGPYVSVYPSGMMFASARQRLTSTCRLHLYLYPFDIQNCNITFTAMNNGAGNIKLGSIYSDTTLFKISEQVMMTYGEWELSDLELLSYTNLFKESKLVYTVTIVRKPMLYVVIFIVPLFYLLVLDLASFFISEARGEKLSFKVTILLSISVLLLILKDLLPSTEDKLPMIANYCVAIFALVGISVLEAMLVSFLTDLDSRCCTKTQRSVDAQEDIQLEFQSEPAGAAEEGQVKAEKHDPPLDKSRDRQLLKLILEEVKQAQREAGRQDKDQRKPGGCRNLAVVVDYVFFVLYFLIVISFLLYMYLNWVHNYLMNYPA